MPDQPVAINFAQGLNQRVDPWQLPIGQFSVLENSVFNKAGMLQKRNGYEKLPSLPNTTYAYLTTFKNNLTAIGPTISAFNESSQAWISKGTIEPMKLSVQALIRNNLNQSQCDSVVSSGGLVCTVYTESTGAATSYKYVISDQETGQNITAPAVIPVASGVVTGSPRVFLLNRYFVIVFTNVITAVSHLQYVAIPLSSPSTVSANQDIASSYISSTTLSWDGVVFSDQLYIAYNTTTGGQAIKVTYLTEANVALAQVPITPVSFAGRIATMVTLAVDSSTNNAVIYVSFYDSAGSTGYTLGVDSTLATVLTPTQIIASGTILNLASAAQNGVCTIFEEFSNNYSYDAAVPTHYIQAVTITQAGVVGTPFVSVRSLGLASKAFIISGQIYYLGAFQSPFQPTYFMINGSTSTAAAPVITAKLAYENGGGYRTTGLSQACVIDDKVLIAYLFKDLIQALTVANDTQQSVSGGIYSQTGVNLASFEFTTSGIQTAEIGSNLHISGGYFGMYDGYQAVEHSFFLWPDSVEVTTSGAGGVLTAQEYRYQAIYEWSDNQGNIHRSAPSIPVAVTTTGATSSNTVNVPTLRLTMKTANAVKITIYRWSVAQPVYHQITSITVPKLNSTTTDQISFVDTVADATIQGNAIVYTTGGVLEDISAPATNIMTLFDTRLWLVDAEDQDLLWYSKQVIESTPVEMSDLLTFYVAPNIGTTPSTGPITALAPMDDKLIIFKRNAIYYINGAGPDNSGANNQYGAPVFVSSVVGCIDQTSIVLMNNGLMFQTDKGIWLLKRDLSVGYIGAGVDDFGVVPVTSAINVPGQTQTRQVIDTGETLMFDYFYEQWGTFVGCPSISSTLYENLHTYINDRGEVFRESVGQYLDGSNPVLMSWATGWINPAILQGYERFKYFYLLGRYLSPHKLQVDVSYNFIESPFQSVIIAPNNYSASATSPYGTPAAPYGTEVDLEQWKIHIKQQKCQSFKITVRELFDPTYGTTAGAGLTLSGISMVIKVKKGTRPLRATNTAG